jgi:hypothetical protein
MVKSLGALMTWISRNQIGKPSWKASAKLRSVYMNNDKLSNRQ